MKQIQMIIACVCLAVSANGIADQLNLDGLNYSAPIANDRSVINSNYNHVDTNTQQIFNNSNNMKMQFNGNVGDGATSIQDSLTNNQGGTYNVTNSSSSTISPIQVISNTTSANNAISITDSNVGSFDK